MGWNILIMVIFFIHIPVSAFCMEVLHMSELASAIIGGAAGIIAAIITGAITVGYQNSTLNKIVRHLGFGEDEASMKKQLEDKLGSSRKSVAEQLGVGAKSISEQIGVDTKSITEQLGVETKSISEQLGVGSNDKSITSQLGVNSKSITEQLGVGSDDKSITAQHREIYDTISSIYGMLHDTQVRQDAENTSQADLAATMAAFQQSYVALINENAALKSENLSLKSERSLLLDRLADLQARSNAADNNYDESMDR